MREDRRPGPSTRVRVHEVVTSSTRSDAGPEAACGGTRTGSRPRSRSRSGWPGRAARPARVAVTMRTPGHDFELAAGFLYAEGVLASADDLRTVAYCTDADAQRPSRSSTSSPSSSSRPPRRAPADRYAGLAAASSACGVCGTESIDDVLALCDVRAVRPVGRPAGARRGAALAAGPAARGPAGLRLAPAACTPRACSTPTGTPFVVREDIGRHNAVDKVVGARVLAGESPGRPAAVRQRPDRLRDRAEGRRSAGIGVLAAVGAPSSLAVDLAAAGRPVHRRVHPRQPVRGVRRTGARRRRVTPDSVGSAT